MTTSGPLPTFESFVADRTDESVRLKELDKLASELVGKSGSPNVYFVCVDGPCVMITTDKEIAMTYYNQKKHTAKECTIEDRTGEIGS